MDTQVFKCLSCDQLHPVSDAISEAQNVCVTCIDTLGWQEVTKRVEHALHANTVPAHDLKPCPLCGEPTKEIYVGTGEYVHSQCAKGYEQYWDEREAELQYRASTGNDPRARLGRFTLS